MTRLRAGDDIDSGLYGDGAITPLPDLAVIIGPSILDGFCEETKEMGIDPNLQMEAIEADKDACAILRKAGIF